MTDLLSICNNVLLNPVNEIYYPIKANWATWTIKNKPYRTNALVSNYWRNKWTIVCR